VPSDLPRQTFVHEGFLTITLMRRDMAAPRRIVSHHRGALAMPVNRPSAQEIEMNEKLLGEIAARLAEAAASNPARDLEKNARAVLATAFARLDLVTREEFDVQSEVLARARTRVAELEAKVAALEARISTNI
jgi:BMFP domain-containing protein YqiC